MHVLLYTHSLHAQIQQEHEAAAYKLRKRSTLMHVLLYTRAQHTPILQKHKAAAYDQS